MLVVQKFYENYSQNIPHRDLSHTKKKEKKKRTKLKCNPILFLKLLHLFLKEQIHLCKVGTESNSGKFSTRTFYCLPMTTRNNAKIFSEPRLLAAYNAVCQFYFEIQYDLLHSICVRIMSVSTTT